MEQHLGERELRAHMALVGGFFQPLRAGCGVFRHVVAVDAPGADERLGAGVTFFGGPLHQLDAAGRIGRDARAFELEGAQPEERLGLAGVGGVLQELQALGAAAGLAVADVEHQAPERLGLRVVLGHRLAQVGRARLHVAGLAAAQQHAREQEAALGIAGLGGAPGLGHGAVVGEHAARAIDEGELERGHQDLLCGTAIRPWVIPCRPVSQPGGPKPAAAPWGSGLSGPP
ncbi:hypothetical protein D3C72_1120150 [compost metagenome]